MSDANGASALPEGTLTEGAEGTTGKGKGKAVDQAPVHDASMDEDDDSEEDEEEQAQEEPEEEDEDNMEEIDPDNIVSNTTRGKQINFAEAQQKMLDAGEELDDDEDEEDDEDFEPEGNAMDED